LKMYPLKIELIRLFLIKNQLFLLDSHSAA